MKHSIFVRTFSMTAILLMTSFLLFGISVAACVWIYDTSGREAVVARSAERMREAVKSYAISNTIIQNEMLFRSLELASDLSGFHIVVTNADGLVVATSDGVDATGGLRVGEAVISELRQTSAYTGGGKLDGLYNSHYFSVGQPVVGFGALEPSGYVFVSAHTESFKQLISQYIKLFFFMGAGILLACCVWAYFYTRKLTLPIKTVAAASREFARGNLSVRVPETARDEETRELAISFNSMAQSLEKNEERRRDFIANISHELKTPMTSITGYVDGILDGVIPPEKTDGYLRIVSGEAKRLGRLVTEMLEVSRVETGETVAVRQAFDLCELARQVVLGQEKKITDKNMDVDLNLDHPMEVYADRDAITRVLHNLVDNAAKYGDEGTTIHLSAERRGSKALFTITDTGKPIPPDEQKLIFERFHKTDRSRRSEGLGLGLYLVKSILANHGEDVWCECHGSKTTLVFTLPLYKR